MDEKIVAEGKVKGTVSLGNVVEETEFRLKYIQIDKDDVPGIKKALGGGSGGD